MEIIIKSKDKNRPNLREWWEYRELFYIFVWRDIKVRYKQTLLGITWVLFQPVVTTLIFSIIFGNLAKISSGKMPYPLFVFAGLTVWSFFSTAVTNASVSLVSYESMIKKVYFPRIIIPLTAILTSAIDFLVTLIFLALLVFYFHYSPDLTSLVISPLLLATLTMTIIGLSLFTCALNVKYRDVRYALPFLIQIGLFASPIIYPLSIITDNRKWFLYLNPLSGVIEPLRAMITNGPVDWFLVITGFVVAATFLVFGFGYFLRTERSFADIT